MDYLDLQQYTKTEHAHRTFLQAKQIIFLFGYYVTSRKIAGSSSDEVIGFFPIYLIQLHYGPWVDSASNRNEYQEYSWNVLGGKGRPARKADNLVAICESISQNYWVFGLCPLSSIIETRKHNIS
jgi:hypothetical protein